MLVNKVIHYYDLCACRVPGCSNAAQSQKAFLKRSIYILFKVFFHARLPIQDPKKWSRTAFFLPFRTAKRVRACLCVCMRAGGRED